MCGCHLLGSKLALTPLILLNLPLVVAEVLVGYIIIKESLFFVNDFITTTPIDTNQSLYKLNGNIFYLSI